ncbi:hypothetical protein LTR28_007075 [Elasticomyces elasticus]|nr:hypothetical protein LTR28_007075 [Elasticomyces elasticus]
MPPPASKLAAIRPLPTRQTSKAPDASSIANANANAQADNGSRSTRNSLAIDEVEGTPMLDSIRKGNISPTGSLPEAAVTSVRRSDTDSDANRTSFTSLYSIGSALYNTARGTYSSAPSSVAGSEADGKVWLMVLPRLDHSNNLGLSHNVKSAWGTLTVNLWIDKGRNLAALHTTYARKCPSCHISLVSPGRQSGPATDPQSTGPYCPRADAKPTKDQFQQWTK